MCAKVDSVDCLNSDTVSSSLFGSFGGPLHMKRPDSRGCTVRIVPGTVLSPGRGPDLISGVEWECMCAGRHSVLVEGPDGSTDALVRLLEPHLRGPVLWRPVLVPFVLPAGECGTLVLQNVAALTRHDQAGVLRWLDDSHERKHVVSTTAHPLFPLVEQGLFDEALYYCLNVLLLRLS
jgi:hypothetical protein